MPIEKTIALFEYDELESETAKENARQWFLDAMDASDYADAVIEDAAQVAAILGIEFDEREYRTVGGKIGTEPAVYWSGFCSQGDGASFDGTYVYKIGAARAIRKYAPQDSTLHAIADSLQQTQARHFYKLRATCKQSGHYMHSGCMRVNVYDARNEYRDIGAAESEICSALRQFADWIYRQLEKEYEHQTEDETIEENIRANEYTFTASGKREDA